MRCLCLVVCLSACASAHGAGESNVTGAPPVIVTTDRIIQGERPRSSVTTIAVPPATAWPVVKKVYQALGVDVTVDDLTSHQVGNQNFWKTRTFAGHRMSELVGCGSGMTGPKADEYRIYMTLITRINPDGQGGTRLETLFVPVGQDVSGGSADRIPCGSTGTLEGIINESVRATLGK